MSHAYKNSTYEELLSILNEKKVIDSKIKNHTEFSYFLNAFNIKHGKETITVNAFYKLYKHWSKEPIDIVDFKTLLINAKFIKRGKVALNINQLKVTEKLLQHVKKDNRFISDKLLEMHFNKFFDYYLIKPGDVLINELDVLFLYTQWCFYSNKQARSKLNLKNMLSLNFTKKITKQGNFYLMNNNVKNIIAQEKLLGELKKNDKKEE